MRERRLAGPRRPPPGDGHCLRGRRKDSHWHRRAERAPRGHTAGGCLGQTRGPAPWVLPMSHAALHDRAWPGPKPRGTRRCSGSNMPPPTTRERSPQRHPTACARPEAQRCRPRSQAFPPREQLGNRPRKERSALSPSLCTLSPHGRCEVPAAGVDGRLGADSAMSLQGGTSRLWLRGW